jgi:hypothetical protein
MGHIWCHVPFGVYPGDMKKGINSGYLESVRSLDLYTVPKPKKPFQKHIFSLLC